MRAALLLLAACHAASTPAAPPQPVATTTPSDAAIDALAPIVEDELPRIVPKTHADERERDSLTLSDTRAQVVRSMLVKRGVRPERLVMQGYGDSQPIDKRHTAEARAKNRRVAFLAIKREPSP